MKKANARIGFNDQWLMVCVIPVLTFIIPVIFFDLPFYEVGHYYTLKFFMPPFFSIVLIWIGNRFILIWARNKYSDFSLVRKRITIQALIMLIYTVIASNTVGFILGKHCILIVDADKQNIGSATIIRSTCVSILITLAMAAIYETHYFISKLKNSIEEKELLKRESLNAQLDALRTQISPHFFFNNLNTLIAIIPDDPETAVNFVQQLSKIYRHILEIKDELSVSLKEELSVLHSYIFLLQTRFGKSLDIQVTIDETKMSRMIVPLSIQMLMENAIKHNITSSERPLHVRIYVTDDKLVVYNNVQLKKHVNESIGLGLENIRKRCELLTGNLLEVVSKPDKFVVSIPLIEK